MKIELTKTAIKALDKMNHKVKISILEAIKNIPNGDIKELKGFKDKRKRLRVGKYRVIYRIETETKIEILLVLDIGSRGDIYK